MQNAEFDSLNYNNLYRTSWFVDFSSLDIFPQEKFQLASAERMAGGNMMNLPAMEQTRKLANTLAENSDPKFQVDILYIIL